MALKIKIKLNKFLKTNKT